MRVLLLTKYGNLGASSRLRTLQYVPALRAEGWVIDIQPLLDDDYLSALYAKRSIMAHVLSGYSRRLGLLLARRAYDVVWIEKEAFPWVPFLIEKCTLPKRPRYVVDYDDAMFHRYDQHSNPWVRRLLGKKIDQVMARADVVTVGNDYLGMRAERAGARRVQHIPTVVDTSRYTVKDTRDRSKVPVIGWIGSPDTVRFLAPQFEIFSRLKERRSLRMIAIGARPDQVEGSPFEAVPWTEATETELLRSLDVGIMPLQDTPWQRGKCGYKLIQYMACGLPVVASPVGVNSRIVEQGQTGFLASSGDEWLEAMERLLDDDGLRTKMGREGRARVDEKYSLAVQAPRVVSMLRSLVAEA